MDRKSALEAGPILQRSLEAIVRVVPSTGRTGSDLRIACANLSVNAVSLLQADAVGPPLANCFNLAVKNNATEAQLAVVRKQTLAEMPILLGAVLLRDAIVRMCLASEGTLISVMSFTSRADVEALQTAMNLVFRGVEETAADEMDQATFQSIVALHAAINGFLTNVARPLPIMLRFLFGRTMASIVMAHTLYADASRGDELRAENKIVHPAFMRRSGYALSG